MGNVFAGRICVVAATKDGQAEFWAAATQRDGAAAAVQQLLPLAGLCWPTQVCSLAFQGRTGSAADKVDHPVEDAGARALAARTCTGRLSYHAAQLGLRNFYSATNFS
jgi:hypothetical protein